MCEKRIIPGIDARISFGINVIGKASRKFCISQKLGFALAKSNCGGYGLATYLDAWALQSTIYLSLPDWITAAASSDKLLISIC